MLVTNKYSIDDVDKYKYSKYEDNSCVVIYLYVDDMFDMKILGKTKVILGITIILTPNGHKLSQEQYVEKTLKKFEHFNCKLLLSV